MIPCYSNKICILLVLKNLFSSLSAAVEDDDQDVLSQLITGQDPVVDELSIVSVPTGSLLSSQSDKAVGGLSHVTPLSTQLGRPSSSATVTTEGTGFLFSDYPGLQSTVSAKKSAR